MSNVDEALQDEEKVSATLTDEVTELTGELREVRIKTLEECRQICIETGADDAGEEIAQIIYALDQPAFQA